VSKYPSVKRSRHTTPTPENIRTELIAAIESAPSKPARSRLHSPGESPSVAEVVRSLRPHIRRLIVEKNYTLRDAYDLVHQQGLQIEFSTFKGYLYRKDRVREPKAATYFGVGRSDDSLGSARHTEEFADSVGSS
jgi:hypothetical protein